MNKVIKYGLMAALFTPFIFGKHLLYPFVVYRTYFFFFIVDILLIFFIWQYGIAPWKSLVKSKIFRALSVVLGVKFISDLSSGYFASSFWGDYERMMGLITYLHLFAYLLMVVTIFKSGQELKKLFAVNTIVAALVSLYGILQYYSIAFVVNQVDDRLFSTIGNPAFLAGYLLISIFGALYLIIGNEKNPWRGAYSIVIVLMVVSLYLSATRGAILAFVAGFIVMGIYLLIYGRGKLNRYKNLRRLFVAGTFSLMVLFGALFLTLGKENANVTLRRLRSISFEDQSVRTRILLWSLASRAATDKLWLGYGENNIDLALDKYFDSRINEQWFDSSHNMALDLLLAHGVPGVVSVTFLFFYWIRSHILAAKKNLLSGAFGLAALIAYILQSLFIFDTLVVLLPLVLFLALAIRTEKRETDWPEARDTYRSLWLKLSLCAPVLVLLLTYPRSLSAISDVTRGVRSIQAAEQVDSALPILRRGFGKAFFGHSSLSFQIKNAAQKTIKNADYSDTEVDKMLNFTYEVYKKSAAKEGETSRLFVDPAKIRLELEAGKLKEFFAETEQMFSHAISLSPGRFDAHLALAELYVRVGGVEKAVSYLKEVANQMPERANDIYYDLAILELLEGNTVSAGVYLESSVKSGKVLSLKDLEPFALSAVELELWDAAIRVFELMRLNEPKNSAVLANLAQAYKEDGQVEKARETANDLLLLDPSTSDMVEEFLKQISK